MNDKKTNTKVIKNPDGSYMSPDQIVEHFYHTKILPSVEEFSNWFKAKREDVRGLHFSLGMWIRNNYGLWHEDNPHVKINPEPNSKGILDDPKFPDQVSDEIIGKIWDKVHDQSIETQEKEDLSRS